MNQKYLHNPGLFIFLAILGMTSPLSIDMYLPSLPNIAQELNTDSSMVSQTLVVFNIFLAFGVLFFGSISDKYGRKKPLMISLITYGLGCFCCFSSISIWMLIAARALQAFGAGGMMSIPLAVVKDYYKGPIRGKIISIFQSFTVVAPIFAPLLGAALLNFGTWRLCFLVLFFVAAFNIILCLLFQETIPKEEINQGKVSETLKRIFVVGKNKSFMCLLLISAFMMACFFAYLSSASYIYEDFYGLSEAEFSYFFAINATLSLSGPITCVFIGRKVKCKIALRIFFVISISVIVLLFTVAQYSAVTFLISFVIFSPYNSFMRPYVTNILLDLQTKDTGSASGLLNFVFTILGALGMLVGGLPWPNYVSGLAISMAIFTCIAIVIWIYTLNAKGIKIKGVR